MSQASGSASDDRPLSTGEFFVTMLLLGLPFVGFILLLVWSFAGGNANRRNMCRAVLIFTVICIVLGAVSFFTSASLLGSIPGLRESVEKAMGL